MYLTENEIEKDIDQDYQDYYEIPSHIRNLEDILGDFFQINLENYEGNLIKENSGFLIASIETRIRDEYLACLSPHNNIFWVKTNEPLNLKLKTKTLLFTSHKYNCCHYMYLFTTTNREKYLNIADNKKLEKKYYCEHLSINGLLFDNGNASLEVLDDSQPIDITEEILDSVAQQLVPEMPEHINKLEDNLSDLCRIAIKDKDNNLILNNCFFYTAFTQTKEQEGYTSYLYPKNNNLFWIVTNRPLDLGFKTKTLFFTYYQPDRCDYIYFFTTADKEKYFDIARNLNLKEENYAYFYYFKDILHNNKDKAILEILSNAVPQEITEDILTNIAEQLAYKTEVIPEKELEYIPQAEDAPAKKEYKKEDCEIKDTSEIDYFEFDERNLEAQTYRVSKRIVYNLAYIKDIKKLDKNILQKCHKEGITKIGLDLSLYERKLFEFLLFFISNTNFPYMKGENKPFRMEKSFIYNYFMVDKDNDKNNNRCKIVKALKALSEKKYCIACTSKDNKKPEHKTVSLFTIIEENNKELIINIPDEILSGNKNKKGLDSYHITRNK